LYIEYIIYLQHANLFSYLIIYLNEFSLKKNIQTTACINNSCRVWFPDSWFQSSQVKFFINPQTQEDVSMKYIHTTDGKHTMFTHYIPKTTKQNNANRINKQHFRFWLFCATFTFNLSASRKKKIYSENIFM